MYYYLLEVQYLIVYRFVMVNGGRESLKKFVEPDLKKILN